MKTAGNERRFGACGFSFPQAGRSYRSAGAFDSGHPVIRFLFDPSAADPLLSRFPA